MKKGVQIWIKDDTNSLEKTMQSLDQYLDQAGKILNFVEFVKFKQIQPNNTKQIYKLSEYVRLKTRTLSIRSKK